jgi:O-antigen ligase
MKTKKIVELLICLTLFSVSIFACTIPAGSNSNIIEENRSVISVFIAISIIFWFGTIAFLLSEKQINRMPFFISSAVLVFYLISISVSNGDCGEGSVYFTKIGVAVSFVCFLAQVTIWLLFRKKSYAELS